MTEMPILLVHVWLELPASCFAQAARLFEAHDSRVGVRQQFNLMALKMSIILARLRLELPSGCIVHQGKILRRAFSRNWRYKSVISSRPDKEDKGNAVLCRSSCLVLIVSAGVQRHGHRRSPAQPSTRYSSHAGPDTPTCAPAVALFYSLH